jgi:hypothetical protein
VIYRYRVSSLNGADLYGPEFESFKEARKFAEVYASNRSSTVVLGPFEIERVGYLDYIGGTRRSWMRQRSRWVPWDPERGHTVRRPDFIWYEPFDPDRPALANSKGPAR